MERMSHQIASRKIRVKQNCLVIISNTPIVPAMIFRELSGLSRYVQNYYMESPTQMFLDIQTSLNLSKITCQDGMTLWLNSFYTNLLVRLFGIGHSMILSTLSVIMPGTSRMRNFLHS